MKRILGDLRIFQSVYNDLRMSHDLVTDSDDVYRYGYLYHGSDPYNLEDVAFPNTVKLINQVAIDKLKQIAQNNYDDMHKMFDYNGIAEDVLKEIGEL